MDSAALDLLYLTACGLHREAPDPERVKKMELKKVYAAAKYHSLDCLLRSALKKVPGVFSGPYGEKWLEEEHRNLHRTFLFDAERQAVCQGLESMGIWHCPLKGSILKDFYAEPGMRQMTDVDILFDEAKADQVREFFRSRGYEVKSFGEHYDDVYQKKPFYNFEMHRSLFNPLVYPQWASFWGTVSCRLLPVAGTSYCRRMTDEDFYLYFLFHSFKHYDNSGTGLRVLTDCWVWLKEKQDSLDWDYIQSHLDSPQLRAYEKNLRTLALAIFTRREDPAKLAPHHRQMLYYLLSCGTFGERKNLAKSRYFLKKEEGDLTFRDKLLFLKQRLIPTEEWYKMNYQYWEIYHSPFRRFCFLVRRFFHALFFQSKKVIRELKNIEKM